MKNGAARTVRVMELMDPNCDPDDVTLLEKKDTSADESLLMEEDDDDEEALAGDNNDAHKWIRDRSIMRQAYEILDGAGPNGLSGIDFKRKAGTGKLETRQLLKNLERAKLCDIYLKDVGRQKLSFYVAKRFQHSLAKQQNVTPNTNWRKPSPRKFDVMTEQKHERIKTILETLDSHSFKERSEMYRIIVENEAQKSDIRMDRKSFRRILTRLSEESKMVQVPVTVT